MKPEEVVKTVKEMKRLETRRFILGSGKVRELFTLKRITKDYFEMDSLHCSFPITLKGLMRMSTQTQFELV